MDSWYPSHIAVARCTLLYVLLPVVTTTHHPRAFSGIDPQERIEFFFRQHWIRLLPPLFTTAGASASILALGWISSSDHVILVALSICFILVHLRFLQFVYRHFLQLVIVTGTKIHYIKRTLLSINTHHTIDLRMLQDVVRNQSGPVQTVFRYGSIHLDFGIHEQRIHFVPKISTVHQNILTLWRSLRAPPPTQDSPRTK